MKINIIVVKAKFILDKSINEIIIFTPAMKNSSGQ